MILSIALSKEIVKIPEASGIDYCKNTNTLIVANDEGWYYEITTNGKILSKHKIKKYDFEGVICRKKNLIFAIEDRGLLKINRITNKIKFIQIDEKFKNKKVKILDKKEGIEGIARLNDLYYIAKQSKKSKKSFIAIVKIKNNKAKIVDIIKHKIVDTAGLSFYKNYLYMVSDKKNLLIKYDIDKRKVLKKIKLPKMAQEGITFDNNGFFYIADDNGRVMRYKTSYM